MIRGPSKYNVCLLNNICVTLNENTKWKYYYVYFIVFLAITEAIFTHNYKVFKGLFTKINCHGIKLMIASACNNQKSHSFVQSRQSKGQITKFNTNHFF